jgi:hypothetical protein
MLGAPVKPSDMDGDGIIDSEDNCPMVANADQANEDGDMFGDACDPCPQLTDLAIADDDGDQIGDTCDPNRGMADARWLFEGFHNGMPGWPASPNWARASDKVRVTAAGPPSTDDEYITLPLTHDQRTFDNYTVSVAVVIDQLSTGTEHDIGIEVFDQMANNSLNCVLADINGNHVLWLVDNKNSVDQRQAFSWTSGAEYTLRMTRHGMMYTCDVAGPGGPAGIPPFTSALAPRSGGATDIWAYSLTAQLGWVSVVGPTP